MEARLNLESRIGRLSCRTDEVFNFITDFRNFRQFIPMENINNWQASDVDCSFRMPPLGSAKIRISERIPYSKVLFSGVALQKNSFEILIRISENELKLADIRISLTADLDPLLKVVAARPIEQFLARLISEMEKFEKWHDTFK